MTGKINVTFYFSGERIEEIMQEHGFANGQFTKDDVDDVLGSLSAQEAEENSDCYVINPEVKD